MHGILPRLNCHRVQVSMGIAFKNVRTVTTQLETLTTQSGEALDVARKCACNY